MCRLPVTAAKNFVISGLVRYEDGRRGHLSSGASEFSNPKRHHHFVSMLSHHTGGYDNQTQGSLLSAAVINGRYKLQGERCMDGWVGKWIDGHTDRKMDS